MSHDNILMFCFLRWYISTQVKAVSKFQAEDKKKMTDKLIRNSSKTFLSSSRKSRAIIFFAWRHDLENGARILNSSESQRNLNPKKWEESTILSFAEKKLR